MHRMAMPGPEGPVTATGPMAGSQPGPANVGVPDMAARGHADERLPGIAAALLTGGFDKPYTYGLATALAAGGIRVEIIGSDQLDCPEYHAISGIRFLNLRGNQAARAPASVKVRRVIAYYARLLRYAAGAKPKIFHILWNNKFQTFDRTILMLYYRALGKRVMVTAHNINQAARDGHDSAWNRLTLGIQYRLADRVFVHTEGMKGRLCQQFGVASGRVAVVPFGINNDVPKTDLTRDQARAKLGLAPAHRALLFFGSIRPYKGLEHLVRAFALLAPRDPRYRLLIAGAPHFGDERYLEEIRGAITKSGFSDRILARFEFIPDAETEIYFKAADLLVLPYNDISWSGVLILGYTFGLPAVATGVGALCDEIVEGETGLVCPPRNPVALAGAIQRWFDGGGGEPAGNQQGAIRAWAAGRYGWRNSAAAAIAEYKRLTPPRESNAACAGVRSDAPSGGEKR